MSDTLLRMSGGQLQRDPEKWLAQNGNLCPVVDVPGGERRVLQRTILHRNLEY